MTWKEKAISEFHKILLTISLGLKKNEEKGNPGEKKNNLKVTSRTF